MYSNPTFVCRLDFGKVEKIVFMDLALYLKENLLLRDISHALCERGFLLPRGTLLDQFNSPHSLSRYEFTLTLI